MLPMKPKVKMTGSKNAASHDEELVAYEHAAYLSSLGKSVKMDANHVDDLPPVLKKAWPSISR